MSRTAAAAGAAAVEWAWRWAAAASSRPVAVLLGIDPRPILNLLGQGQNQNAPGQPGNAPAAAGRSRGGAPGPLHQGHLPRHRGRLGRTVPQDGQAIPQADAGALQRRGPVRLRLGRRRGRPVLLPRRQQGLHRPVVLPRHAAQAERPAASSPAPTSSPTRSATTSSACSATPARGRGPAREQGRRPIACRCGWNCRPTTSPACGPTTAEEKFKFLEPGDIESALNAAFEIGDDRLQKKARGRVVPDSFTHGTSQQRQRWFEKGFKTGSVEGARGPLRLALRQEGVDPPPLASEVLHTHPSLAARRCGAAALAAGGAASG